MAVKKRPLQLWIDMRFSSRLAQKLFLVSEARPASPACCLRGNSLPNRMHQIACELSEGATANWQRGVERVTDNVAGLLAEILCVPIDVVEGGSIRVDASGIAGLMTGVVEPELSALKNKVFDRNAALATEVPPSAAPWLMIPAAFGLRSPDWCSVEPVQATGCLLCVLIGKMAGLQNRWRVHQAGQCRSQNQVCRPRQKRLDAPEQQTLLQYVLTVRDSDMTSA